MRFRERMASFMYGRRGWDDLCRALLIAAVVLAVIGMFIPSPWKMICSVPCLIALVYGYYRALSRNITARERENYWYLTKFQAVKRWFRSLRDRWTQRKDYRFFRCPSCRMLLRVPRGKGRICLTCRKCGSRFERRS